MSSQPAPPLCTRAFSVVLQRLGEDGFVSSSDTRPYKGFLQSQDIVTNPLAIRRYQIHEVCHLEKDHECGRLLVSVFRMVSEGFGQDAGGVSACHEFNGKLVHRPLVPSLGSFAALREFVTATDPSADASVRMTPTDFIYRLTQPQVYS